MGPSASKPNERVQQDIEPVEADAVRVNVEPKGSDGRRQSRAAHGTPEMIATADEYYQPDKNTPEALQSAHGPPHSPNAQMNATAGEYYQPDKDTPEVPRDQSDGDIPRRHRFAIVDKFIGKRKGFLAYTRTKEFWIVLALGQVLSLCITSTNTFTTLLQNEGTSIPAFQTLFNYVLLNICYSSFTIYRYGFKRWGRLLLKDGWRYFILAFCDVEGNYFTVLAYEYTTILSAQLINFWAIVVVVLVSLIFLHVRYQLTQYAGILICVGGMGLLLASDHITGADGDYAPGQLKGDLFALVGATFYGLSNVFEEFLVSKRPLYEVIGQLAFWGMLINGTQAGIFDRSNFQGAVWNGAVGGYLVGYTLILSLFYTLAPLMFRLASAAFFNISLLTANFWGVIIGLHVFGLHVHYLYPIAFVLIIFGLAIYFITEGIMGEAEKPWLGAEQERGVSGVGTARRRAEARAGAVGEGTPAAGVV